MPCDELWSSSTCPVPGRTRPSPRRRRGASWRWAPASRSWGRRGRGRPGARFGPEAIRSASTLLRPWNPVLEVDVFAGRSVIDYGDLDVTPGNAAHSADQIAAGLEPVLAAGAVPIVLGGDHSVALGEL